MAELGEHFKPDYNNLVSKPQTVFKGQFYRITILSDLLVRLEFSVEGYFEDRPTEFAKFRNFPIPQMKVDQNEKYLDNETDCGIIINTFHRICHESQKIVVLFGLPPV